MMTRLKKISPVFYFFFIGIFFILGGAYLGSNLLFSSRVSAATSQTINPDFQKVYPPEIPPDITFATEKVPLETFDVFERVDREFLVNTYWHSFMLLSFKRAGRWFPVIEPILKKNGIPDDFKYISIIESGLANAISPAGAVGFWQFMESSANMYGLEVNNEIDERYDVEKATEAACKYIRDARRILGSWTLAAASYNMGMAGVSRQLQRQKINSYYDLYLNEETSRYLARVIAIKAIMQNPAKYGYNLTGHDLYPPYKKKKVAVTGRVNDLIDFSIKQGYNYKILKLYNPWLRESMISNKKGKKYLISFPVKEADELAVIK